MPVRASVSLHLLCWSWLHWILTSTSPSLFPYNIIIIMTTRGESCCIFTSQKQAFLWCTCVIRWQGQKWHHTCAVCQIFFFSPLTHSCICIHSVPWHTRRGRGRRTPSCINSQCQACFQKGCKLCWRGRMWHVQCGRRWPFLCSRWWDKQLIDLTTCACRLATSRSASRYSWPCFHQKIARAVTYDFLVMVVTFDLPKCDALSWWRVCSLPPLPSWPSVFFSDTPSSQDVS